MKRLDLTFQRGPVSGLSPKQSGMTKMVPLQ
jgi:hypothetical protein